MRIKPNGDFWLLLGLSLLGFGARSFHLDLRSISLDEAYTLAVVRSGLGAIIASTANDIHPPMFYLVLWVWRHLAGPGLLPARILTSVFSTLCVPLSYCLARLWADRKGAWWAAVLVAVSPYFVELGRWSRMASLNALLCGLAMYFFWQAFTRKKSPALFVAYAIVTLAALYTHYFAFLLLACQYLFLGVLYLRHDQNWLKSGRLQQWLAAQAMIILGFLPWAIVFATHVLRKLAAYGNLHGFRLQDALLLYYYFMAGSYNWGWLNKLLVIAATALAGAGLLAYYLPRIRTFPALLEKRVWLWFGIVLFFPWLATIVYSLIGSNIVDRRYLSFSALVVFILLGQALSRLPWRMAVWIAILLAVGFFPPLRNQWFDYGPIENWRQVANLVNTHKTVQDILLLHPNFIRLPLGYYLDQRLPVVSVPTDFDPVHFKIENPKALTPAGLDPLGPAVQPYQRVWLVISRHDTSNSEKVKTWLEDRYGPPQAYAFNFIRVYLFVRPD